MLRRSDFGIAKNRMKEARSESLRKLISILDIYHFKEEGENLLSLLDNC